MMFKSNACYLMPNHVHLLICEKKWKQGEVMKSIATYNVIYYLYKSKS